ncbi:unnamed protein product, partial [Rotaria sp. Silwood2]
METPKSRSSAETQGSNSMRISTTSTKRLSFQETVCGRIDDNIVLINICSHQIILIFIFMLIFFNILLRRTTHVGSNISDNTPYQRRGAMTLEK